LRRNDANAPIGCFSFVPKETHITNVRQLAENVLKVICNSYLFWLVTAVFLLNLQGFGNT
jgi:hypothetical protein